MRASHRTNLGTLNWITAAVSALCIGSALFLGFIVRQDRLLAQPITLRGMQVLSALSTGSLPLQLRGQVYALDVPGWLSMALLGLIALHAASIVLSFLGRRGRRAAGALSLVSFIVLAVGFAFVMLDDGTSAASLAGDPQPFYRLYAPGVGYGVWLALAATGFLVARIETHTLSKLRRFWFLYALMAIPIVLTLIYAYYPILLQTVLSFKDYRAADGIWGSPWTGLTHFQTIFADPDMARVIGNTVYISFLRLVSGFLPPLLLALMLYEIRSKWLRQGIQAVLYIPHFFSWVVIFGIVFAFLSPAGIVNNLFKAVGRPNIDFLTQQNLFLPIQILTAIWKELGWGTIVYLAALSSVDVQLYDAAAIDGIGPLRRIRYITLPQIAPVIVFLLIMAVGNILKGAGGEQILVFANSAVMRKAEVIDTWVFWQGLGNMQYGLSAAVSFFQSGIGIVLMLLANKLSIKLAGRGLW